MITRPNLINLLHRKVFTDLKFSNRTLEDSKIVKD